MSLSFWDHSLASHQTSPLRFSKLSLQLVSDWYCIWTRAEPWPPSHQALRWGEDAVHLPWSWLRSPVSNAQVFSCVLNSCTLKVREINNVLRINSNKSEFRGIISTVFNIKDHIRNTKKKHYMKVFFFKLVLLWVKIYCSKYYLSYSLSSFKSLTASHSFSHLTALFSEAINNLKH
jgi:hypothetical protein